MDFSAERSVSLNALMPVIRERLSAGCSVQFFPKGTSMLPMLRQGKDSVVLSPLPEQLKKYDLPLYRRDNGQYVLHRIVAVGATYTCIGDNQVVKETGLRREQMIGLVTAFSRGDGYCPVTRWHYRLYCRVWHYSRWVRRILRFGKESLFRMLGRKGNR